MLNYKRLKKITKRKAKMFEIYTNDETVTQHRPTGPEDTWLESSADGLLTLEAEKFLLSLPFDYVPGTTALVRPDLINQLATHWYREQDAQGLIEKMIEVESKTYADNDNQTETMQMELQVLRAWLESKTEAVELFVRH
jgi:hypothetical protein